MAASGSDIEFTLPAFDHLIIARFLFLFASLLFHLLFWRLQNAVLSFMIHSCILQGSLVPLFLQFAVHGNGWFLQEQQPDGSCLPTPFATYHCTYLTLKIQPGFAQRCACSCSPFLFSCRRTGDVEVKEDNKTQLCSFCLAQCASVWGALLGPKGSLGCIYIQI